MSEYSTLVIKLKSINKDVLHRLKEDMNEKMDNTLQIFDKFDVRIFPQTWGSTALGFEGIGLDSLTTEHTYVLIPYDRTQKCLVYFGERFAYEAKYSDRFMFDVLHHHMVSVKDSAKYS